MNSSRLLTFGRVLMAVIFVILAPSYAYAQEGRPRDEELGEAARILITSANWLKEKDNGEKCSLLKDAKALVEAVQVLRKRLVSDKGEILDTEKFISDLDKQIAVACIPTSSPLNSSLPKPKCELGKEVGSGGHESEQPVPEMVLAYLYMTEDKREGFVKDLSPATSSALTDWLYETPDTVRNDIITSVREEIGSEISWPSGPERSINADENDLTTADRVSQAECENAVTIITTEPHGHKRPVYEIALAFLYMGKDRREKFVEKSSPDTVLLLTDWLYEPHYEAQGDILRHVNEEFTHTAQSEVLEYINKEFNLSSWSSEFNLSWSSEYEIDPKSVLDQGIEPENGIFDPRLWVPEPDILDPWDFWMRMGR